MSDFNGSLDLKNHTGKKVVVRMLTSFIHTSNELINNIRITLAVLHMAFMSDVFMD